MSSLTTNPVNLADHRTKLVADAVISAYLSEISRPQPVRRISAPAPAPAAAVTREPLMQRLANACEIVRPLTGIS